MKDKCKCGQCEYCLRLAKDRERITKPLPRCTCDHNQQCDICDRYYRLWQYLERVKKSIAFGPIKREDMAVSDLAVGQEFTRLGYEGTVVGRAGGRNDASGRTICVIDPGYELKLPNRAEVTALSQFSKVFTEEAE